MRGEDDSERPQGLPDGHGIEKMILHQKATNCLQVNQSPGHSSPSQRGEGAADMGLPHVPEEAPGRRPAPGATKRTEEECAQVDSI